MIGRAAALGLGLAASQAAAEGLPLTIDERAAFRAEVRALLLDEPELILRALDGAEPEPAAPVPAPPAPDYADEIARDQQIIRDEAYWLFSQTDRGFGSSWPRLTIAVFMAGNCADCAAALSDLIDLTRRHRGLRIELRPLDTDPKTIARLGAVELFGPERLARSWTAIANIPAAKAERMRDEAVSAERLGLDMAPSYVFPDMFVRGHVPAAVLEHYIARY
ncbi:hypothetical protein [Oceanicola sp. 22II-s10i]|uniref:hypothetical protein n=1 Tax=Oceanicola sp. 22II-s10i TaxID=1317116 RepID=UPI000B5269F8|nr:hypothetical protein [Oceanicola sp. 22II-s10i]